MKTLKSYLIKESSCGGYNSGDVETVGDALLNSLGDDYDADECLADDYGEIGWKVFDLESAAEELDIDVDELEDYIDNYAARLEDYLGI